MKNQIEQYIEEKKYAWGNVTTQKESSKLLHLSHIIEQRNPALLWKHLIGHTPYSRVHIFNGVCSLFTWLEGENNVFSDWRNKNRRLFKNYYTRKLVNISFEEAKERIEKLPQPYKNKALQLLFTGLRYTESWEVITPNSFYSILGKGGKERKVFFPSFLPPTTSKKIPYVSMAKALNKVGLKAHDLRKLYATKMVEKGCKEADLLKIMGWSSISTAALYLQPKRDEEIMNIVETLC